MGGIYQISPETLSGEIIMVVTRFFGIILFGILILLINNIFRKFFFGKKE
jgi:hypothetical protein